jgi:hypothetical protein
MLLNLFHLGARLEILSRQTLGSGISSIHEQTFPLPQFCGISDPNNRVYSMKFPVTDYKKWHAKSVLCGEPFWCWRPTDHLFGLLKQQLGRYRFQNTEETRMALNERLQIQQSHFNCDSMSCQDRMNSSKCSRMKSYISSSWLALQAFLFDLGLPHDRCAVCSMRSSCSPLFIPIFFKTNSTSSIQINPLKTKRICFM